MCVLKTSSKNNEWCHLYSLELVLVNPTFHHRSILVFPRNADIKFFEKLKFVLLPTRIREGDFDILLSWEKIRLYTWKTRNNLLKIGTLCILRFDFFNFRSRSKSGPGNICEKSKKSQKNEKWDWRKVQSENTFLRTRHKLNHLLDCQNVQIVYFTRHSLQYKISYFYDIEILCEKQSYFHCVPWGKEDYCINVYMILMLMLTSANPARVSLF